jgi:hypothetical protein
MPRHIIMAFLLSFSIGHLAAQADSTEDDLEATTKLTRTFKKGFYISYDEFLNNAPSVSRSFQTIKKTLSRKKSLHANYRARYDLDEGEKAIKEKI